MNSHIFYDIITLGGTIMILQKTEKINVNKINSMDFLDSHIKELMVEYLKVENEYRYALREFSAKLENLDDYCQTNYDHNPIHHMESRLKTPRSIFEKIEKRGYELTLESLTKEVHDIAGIRVVCNYMNDIYQIIDLLTKQKDIKVLLTKDYIVNPKTSGYRSVHMVFSIEIYMNSQTRTVPVEIQFRTLAMDMWASLEHELRYKSKNEFSDVQKQKLREYSDDLYKVDLNMQRMYIVTTVGEDIDD